MITDEGLSYPCACPCPECGTWNFPAEVGKTVRWDPCRKCGAYVGAQEPREVKR
jgi:hypothetical protein